METEHRPLISFTWREGKYLDLWSIEHVLTGALMGLVATFLPLPFSGALVLAIALFILYEWLEAIFGIGEILENRVVDVLIASAGFAYLYRVVERVFSREETFVLSGVLVVAVAAFAFLGWRARVKRRLTSG